MFNRVKHFFESVAYAGLRPSGGKPLAEAESKKPGLFAPLHAWVEKFLNQGGSSDPLYLSNRTFMQRARVWMMVGVLPVLLLGGLGLVLGGVFTSKPTVAPPPVTLTDAQLAQRMLPDLNVRINSQHDLDVQDVHVIRAGSLKLAGSASNKTDHLIHKADIVFELTDSNGSRQGAVSTQLINLAANTTVPFQFSIDQQAASFALVREIHVQ